MANLLAKIFVRDPEQRASINDLRDDPWVNYEEVEKPLRIFPINAQEMEQIVSGITNGNGFVSYIFRDPASSSKKKESTVNLNNALSQNNINDCQLFNNERRKSYALDEIIKRRMNNSNAKSPLSPENIKSPFRNMTGCEIPNMDIWGGVLVDSALSKKIRNKKYSSVMETGSGGLFGGMKTEDNYHSVTDITRSSSQMAANRHYLRLNTNIGNVSNAINSSSVDERPTKNPRYYSIINITDRNENANNSEDSINSANEKVDGVAPLKSYSKSVSQITDESLYKNNNGPKLNNKSNLAKLKSDSKQIKRSNSFGLSFLGKKKNNNNIVDIVPGVEENVANSGPISPLNPNHPLGNSNNNKNHGRSSSVHSISINTKVDIINSPASSNLPSPLKKESKLISKSVNISPASTKVSSPVEIFSDSFDSFSDSASPEDGEIPNYQEIEMWHLIHKPSKTVRSIRLSFNKSTATTKPPFSLFQNLCWALYEMRNVYANRFYFVRNSDYYLFECNLLNEDLNNVDVKFEVEVCKVWLLKLHALRLKRISGDPFLYEELYSELISLIKGDEHQSNDSSPNEEKIPDSNEIEN